MANTLTWPNSLQKKINDIKSSEKDKSKATKAFLISIAVAIILFLIGSITINSPLSNILAILIWLCVLVAIFSGTEVFRENADVIRYSKGHEGEMRVAKVLDNLPGEWFIVNDITVNGAQIDHIAIGPSGVFCLETKNWNNAGCDAEGNWYRLERGRWMPTHENPSRQNAAHVMALKNFLYSHGIQININSVIVLAHESECYNIASRIIPPTNTIICRYYEIAQYLQVQKIILDPNLFNKISDIFIKQYM